MNISTIIETVAQAIGNEEGIYDRKKVPSIPQRLNNPGCLRSWKAPTGTKNAPVAYPTVNGYVEFPTVEIGWEALRTQCKINIVKRGLTFREFFGGKPKVYGGFSPWTNGKGNTPLLYASNVLAYVKRRLSIEGITIDTPIVSLADDYQRAA